MKIYKTNNGGGIGIEKRNYKMNFALNNLRITPNPFNPITTILLPRNKPVNISIYRLSGEEVARHVAVKGAFTWNAADLPSGVYMLKVINGEQTVNKRLILSK